MSHSSFVPFCTFIDTTFWAELNRRKLHEWRLDETPREVFPFADDGKLISYFNDTKFYAFLLDSKGNCASMQDLGGIEDAADVKIVFADPSPVADCAGWPLRNLVAAVAYMKRSWRWCSFVSLKGGGDLKEFKISWDETEPNQLPASVGWERNMQGKMVPQFVDMRKQFDPKK
ncbi:hypothetical protein OSTOST_07239 [Ostertagia ostertagi]